MPTRHSRLLTSIEATTIAMGTPLFVIQEKQSHDSFFCVCNFLSFEVIEWSEQMYICTAFLAVRYV